MEVSEWLEKRGIKELFPVQKKALAAGLLDFKNLLVSAPTGSGKTLVAEIAIFNALKYGYKVAYLLPLRSIAFEKYRALKEVFPEAKVELSVGDYHSPKISEDVDVLVATYERMDSILRHAPPWLEDLGAVVVDEVHYVGDPERGPTLESVVTQLKREGVQLVALSATVGNLDEMAEWLEAELVVDSWRPVKLVEGVMNADTYEIFFDGGLVERVEKKFGKPALDASAHYLKFGQVLFFASTRRRAEKAAEEMKRIMKGSKKSEYWAERIRVEVEGELGEKLASLVERGVAFHHAGLTNEARVLVEDAFRDGAVKFIAATPTLAAGVNLPSRTVVIESYLRYDSVEGHVPISVAEYKQMAGRAGRPGLDEVGVSVLVAKDDVRYAFERYVKGKPEKVKSSLDNPKSLRRTLLGLISRRVIRNEEELREFMKETLFGVQEGPRGAVESSERVIKFLQNLGAVSPSLAPTPLGALISKLYVDPLGVKVVRDALRRRVGATKPLGYLHLISLTPDMPKRMPKASEVKKLIRIADERYDELLVRDPAEPFGEDVWLGALKIALILEDWVNEVPDDVISKRHNVYPGDVRVYSDTAAWLVHAYSELASFLGMKRHAQEMAKLEKRIKYGVREELVELVSLPYIGRVRARLLWEAGIRSKKDFIEKKEVAAKVIGKGVVERVLEALGVGRKRLVDFIRT